jgi:hypothetical protein
MNKLIKFAVLTLFFTFMCHTQYILVLSSFRVNFKLFYIFDSSQWVPTTKIRKKSKFAILISNFSGDFLMFFKGILCPPTGIVYKTLKKKTPC